MSDDRTSEQAKLRVLYSASPRARRRQLPGLLRILIIATIGALVGLLAFYLLKTIGY